MYIYIYLYLMKQPRPCPLVHKVQVMKPAPRLAGEAPDLDCWCAITFSLPNAAAPEDHLVRPKSKSKKGKARHNHHAWVKPHYITPKFEKKTKQKSWAMIRHFLVRLRNPMAAVSEKKMYSCMRRESMCWYLQITMSDKSPKSFT